MPAKKRYEEGDPVDGEYNPELDERLRTLQPDDPTFNAWLKKMYGYNPYLKEPGRVKVRRNPKHPRRS